MASIAALLASSAKLQDFEHRYEEKYDRQIRDLVASLHRSLSSNALNFAANDPTILDNFDPAADSITYLFLLRLQIQTLQETSPDKLPADLLPSRELWTKCVRYLKNFNPTQVRYVGHEWRQLVELVAQAAQAASKPFLATQLIKDAMLRLDPSCAVFTSTHLLLVRLCLHAKAYACILPVLNKHICHFPGSTERFPHKSSPVLCADHESSLAFITNSSGLSAPLSSRDLSRYFLYGGMVYLALKKWSEASHFLELAMSVPTTGPVSMIMVEAYKKWVLVGLLETGKLRPPPTMIAPHVYKTYQSIARPYVNLAHTFELRDLNRLNAEVDAAKHIWRADNNTGLVSQVLDSFTAHALAGIKSVFAALTVTELSEQTSSLPENTDVAESVIASLIMSGSVSATLVHTPGHSEGTMLRFPSAHPSSQLHELQVQGRLARESQTLEALVASVKKSNNDIGLGDEFIDHMQKSQVWNGSGTDYSVAEEESRFEVDEDIMGDQI
ncbi:hypothetical protein N7481_003493 [Penicillium waksmanii]|uniref:uncharacterized protein n=1 Tax=Penicillium waksmanii TaxID=69791 RepID=UPI002548E4C4|nr:uncharacterized protein N7481_003493 [Penicillium waksmanii]KAJ5988283.1 hypothetical protein N7481_003493 [Penicillium waksmanii]